MSDQLTHIVEPRDDLGLGRGVGPDVAVEVDVVALPDVSGHEAAPQLDRHDRRICEEGEAKRGEHISTSAPWPYQDYRVQSSSLKQLTCLKS